MKRNAYQQTNSILQSPSMELCRQKLHMPPGYFWSLMSPDLLRFDEKQVLQAQYRSMTVYACSVEFYQRSLMAHGPCHKLILYFKSRAGVEWSTDTNSFMILYSENKNTNIKHYINLTEENNNVFDKYIVTSYRVMTIFTTSRNTPSCKPVARETLNRSFPTH